MDSSRTLPADVSRELLDELLAFKGLFEAAASIVADGLVHLDERRRVVRFNAAAERILGCSAAGVIGSDFSALCHASNTANPFQDGAAETHLLLRDTRGDAVAVHSRSIATRRGGDVEGWLLAFSPTRRVDEIEQLKNELVSTVSHELKTPLAAIKAYTATLRQNPALYDSQREDFLKVVEQQADRLSRMVEDMLLVARVETSQMLRRRVVVPLDSVLDDALSDLPYDALKHPVRRETANVDVSGDPERLRDVFRNLLENAMKYSPQGGPVEIVAEQREDMTSIEVRDRGVGIAGEHVPYIFDRFYRAESAATAEVGGSGLGLYIVHALVRAHGGTIDVRSAPDKGSTFRVRLPLR